MNDQHDLELVLRSHFPIVRIETHEERRAIELLTKTAKAQQKRLVQWTVTDGLKTLLYSDGRSNPSGDKLSLVDHDAPINTEEEATPATVLRTAVDLY